MLTRMAAQQAGKAGEWHLTLVTKLSWALSTLRKGGKQSHDLGATAPPPNSRRCVTWMVHASSQTASGLDEKNGLARRRTLNEQHQ
jgi:hypothetical protein